MPQRQTPAGTEPKLLGAAADAAPAANQDGEIVSLHDPKAAQAAVAAPAAAPPAPEVFAEIWKDGVKIGSVYTDGTATLPAHANGLTAGVHAGTRPYIQAQELSRIVGGEVRYVDLPALQVARTRNQLRTAYGA
jgi:hypothetical protein